MNRSLALMTAAAVCFSSTSCRLLYNQTAPEEQTADAQMPRRTEGENQITAPDQTEPGQLSDAMSPVPGGAIPASPSLPSSPALPVAPASAAIQSDALLPLPSTSSSIAPFTGDDDNAIPAPATPPAAELRGLRSPKLPSNLPMSLDGKMNP